MGNESGSPGVRNGCLYALLIVGLYVNASVFTLAYLALGHWPDTSEEILTFVAQSWLLTMVGGVGFLPIAGIGLYLALKDPDSGLFWRRNWPIVVALVYPFLPVPIPGPWDEAIVGGIGLWIRYRFARAIAIERTAAGELPSSEAIERTAGELDKANASLPTPPQLPSSRD